MQKMEFREYLQRIRKANGEKYLDKSIDKYCEYIDRYGDKFEGKSFEDMISEMNILIQRINHPNVRASFRHYLGFLGVEEDSKLFNDLKKVKRRASALTSVRIMSSKLLTDKEISILYDSVNDEWKLIIRILLDTCARESELLNIKWKDIVYDEEKEYATIRIFRKGAKYSDVYINKKTYELLIKLRPNIKDNDKIFEFKKKSGELYQRQEKYLYDNIKKFGLKYLNKPLTVHQFRHMGLSKLINSGSDILGVSKYASHASLSTTQIYVKSANNVARDTFEKFSKDVSDY